MFFLVILANWCKQTKHPLEHPALAKQKTKAAESCSVGVGCRGIGNYKFKTRAWHKINDECPYKLLNWKKHDKANRLGNKKKFSSDSSKNNQSENKRPATNDINKKSNKKQMRPNIEPQIIQQAKVPEIIKVEDDFKEDDFSLSNPVEMKPLVKDEQLKLNSVLLKANSTHLPTGNTLPIYWTPIQVANFIKRIPACEDSAHLFETHEINGAALLSCMKDDLVQELGIKFGPAVKIYNCILKLREKVISFISD